MKSSGFTRILVVDDHPDIRLLLSLLIQGAGYHVISAASSCEEARRCAEQMSFGLYILDEGLIDGTGPELREKLRKLHPSTPALYFTGTSYSSSEIKRLRQGGDDYRLKPGEPEELIATIEQLLTTSAARQHPPVPLAVEKNGIAN